MLPLRYNTFESLHKLPLSLALNHKKMIIGNKETFAFEIGLETEKNLRVVDIIINNRYVCCDDNVAYVPQFSNDLKSELEKLENLQKDSFLNYLSGKSIEEIHQFIDSTRGEESENCNLEDDKIYPYFRFLDLGPTTDNFTCFLFFKKNDLYVTYQFWRDTHQNKEELGKVFFAKIDKEEAIYIISETIKTLNI